MAVCAKCGSVKLTEQPCPKCGSVRNRLLPDQEIIERQRQISESRERALEIQQEMQQGSGNSDKCPCPQPVVEWLALAVKYVEATTVAERRSERVAGAQQVKTFMEQPSEVWCNFIALLEEEG